MMSGCTARSAAPCQPSADLRIEQSAAAATKLRTLTHPETAQRREECAFCLSSPHKAAARACPSTPSRPGLVQRRRTTLKAAGSWIEKSFGEIIDSSRDSKCRGVQRRVVVQQHWQDWARREIVVGFGTAPGESVVIGWLVGW